MRNGVLAVSTDDDVGEGMGLKQTHWRPIFLAALSREGIDRFAIRDNETTRNT